MTDDKAFKKAVRARMRATGEKYTSARRAVLAPAAEQVCIYCAKPVLTGRERPEHSVPAALRAGMTVRSACDPCNAWAGAEIDQPFLADDFIRLYRAKHDLRDPRHPTRRVADPFAVGFTEDGVRVIADAEWRPHMQGRILDDGQGNVRVVGGDEDELRRLTERVVRRAEAAGREASIGEAEHVIDHPKISGRLQIRPWTWRRELAKIALACGSEAYPAAWRVSDDATRLRTWMRDPKSLPSDHCPVSDVPERLRALFPPPSHRMYFMATSGTTVLTIVLFGELAFRLPVDTTGRHVPKIAWHLDVAKPTSDGRTTFEQLIMHAALRTAEEDDRVWRPAQL